jgi:two-component system alkaline phosphatase synthesis response regulator PhoP
MERILIADDDSDDLHFTAYALKRQGYSVFLAKNGEEAISKARRLKPDLIILDIVMPKESGLETANTLRKTPSFLHIPIIFLTSLKNSSEAVLDHSNAILAKPLEIIQLLSIIRTLLKRPDALSAT